jgi:hypothetical protein
MCFRASPTLGSSRDVAHPSGRRPRPTTPVITQDLSSLAKREISVPVRGNGQWRRKQKPRSLALLGMTGVWLGMTDVYSSGERAP